jgi:hypothetical protein
VPPACDCKNGVFLLYIEQGAKSNPGSKDSAGIALFPLRTQRILSFITESQIRLYGGIPNVPVRPTQ